MKNIKVKIYVNDVYLTTKTNFTSIKKAVNSVYALGYVNFNYYGLDCVYMIKNNDIVKGEKE